MTSYRMAIIERKCNGCGDCTIACPINKSGKIASDKSQNVVLRIKNGKLETSNQDLCDGCGMCIEACPRHALEIKFPMNKESEEEKSKEAKKI
ncbi:MAG: 4Fe-4S dicluster domain-containing protein [Candidatus Atabeyarchaeum deiterrae]